MDEGSKPSHPLKSAAAVRLRATVPPQSYSIVFSMPSGDAIRASSLFGSWSTEEYSNTQIER